MAAPIALGEKERVDVEAVPGKSDVAHKEFVAANGMHADDAAFLADFPDEKRRKVLAKIDWRLLPMLVLLYLIAYIDKANIGNAKIEGLLPDLGMTGEQYNIALSLYFVPYILAEVPSNMILNKFKKPSQYMALIVLLWGIVMTCHGVVNNFGELIAVRLLLGLFEAGFFPGAILIISKWYLPDETQTRIAILYTSAATGGAFSGLLAFAIAKMDGVANYSGWRWIFIIEGIFTVGMAFATYFLLVDSPGLSPWLSEEERRYLELRQVARRISSSREYRENEKGANKKQLWNVLKDWKLYLLTVMSWSNAAPNYGLKFSMPQIILNMGFTSANAQLMTIPPYFCGALAAYLFSRFADKYKWRMPFIVAPQTCVLVAFAILLVKATNIEDNLGVCYFAVCLACTGMYPILPGVNAWNVDNSAPATKRAISIGFLVCTGNIGGIYGSYIYKADEKPAYPTGFGASMGFAVAGMVCAATLEFMLWSINKKNAKFSEEEIRAKYTDEQLEEMGDQSPLYKYKL